MAVGDLADFVPMPDVGDPQKFLAALVVLFSQYRPEVIAEAVDPVKGIPTRLNVLRIASVKEILDEISGPYERADDRARARDDVRRSLPPPRHKRTPEEQARIDKQVAETRRKLGIPEGGLRRR